MARPSDGPAASRNPLLLSCLFVPFVDLNPSRNMKRPDPLAAVAAKVEAAFARKRIRLTLGGEPTYVPLDPQGPEWTITALGPTKLRYAYALTDSLIAQSLPNAVAIYSPGKSYPGELNPRWAINLLWNSDGSVFAPALAKAARATRVPEEISIAIFTEELLRGLKLPAGWLHATDPLEPERIVRVLPLDHDGKRFASVHWAIGDRIELLRADGPAGLRLPLDSLPGDVSRRALTIEVKDGQLHIFLPPLLQPAFIRLFARIVSALHRARLGPAIFGGYVPDDAARVWTRLAIASDPGVIEVNLPPCPAWSDYRWWMHTLERACEPAGLRSWKQASPEEATGTGGGNHLLFGGPTLDENPLFTHPRWVTSMLRYWQHHPSLAYLFTGQYVGPSSQAPRPDESASALYDLEMAYQFLETLPRGDHRFLISETLRHLHTDGGGSTHRSETSFDKFWNVSFDGGCRGLVEFRAIESLPHAEWMSAIALLWRALAAMLLARPFTRPLTDHGDALHDRWFLPAHLWADLQRVLRDLRGAGFELPGSIFRAIADWRFPVMLQHRDGRATLTVRRALEGWPLLSETPLEGGNTSRFVDTSMERLEFTASAQFAATSEIYVEGRRLELQPFPARQAGAGLRYRRTALYPSLHPGIQPQLPLRIVIKRGRHILGYQLDTTRRTFERSTDPLPAITKNPCRRLHPSLITCDLRLP